MFLLLIYTLYQFCDLCKRKSFSGCLGCLRFSGSSNVQIDKILHYIRNLIRAAFNGKDVSIAGILKRKVSFYLASHIKSGKE